MVTSITQARTLLTKAELTLFDQSRAEPVKAFTVRQLAQKIQRARTLRDKYLDLYRRQRVASRKREGQAGTGEDNKRTQRKAEVFEETLQRLQTQHEKREAQAARAVDRTGKARQARKAPTRGPSPVSLKKAVQDALTTKLQSLHDHGEHPDPIGDAGADRSAKAPSRRSPVASTHAVAGLAPLDMVARAQRMNPVKDRGGSIGIDAHTRVRRLLAPRSHNRAGNWST
ncbi:MAG: hypothetical protein WKG52_10060 [Variovorax sp.]